MIRRRPVRGVTNMPIPQAEFPVETANARRKLHPAQYRCKLN
jgi:hypothetical protein